MLMSFALAAVLLGGDPEGIVTTAPRDATGAVLVGAVAPVAESQPDAAAHVANVTADQLTTQQQIDRWLTARSPDADPFAVAARPVDDRRMHGFVSGAIGTNDYSSASVGVSLPIGESGRLNLSYSQTKNGWGDRYSGYGYDPFDAGIGYPTYGDSVPLRRGRSVSLGFSMDEREQDRSRPWAIDAKD